MNRALWILAVLLSHWRRHPMQAATLAIGLIAATALWSGVQALNQFAGFQPGFRQPEDTPPQFVRLVAVVVVAVQVDPQTVGGVEAPRRTHDLREPREGVRKWHRELARVEGWIALPEAGALAGLLS